MHEYPLSIMGKTLIQELHFIGTQNYSHNLPDQTQCLEETVILITVILESLLTNIHKVDEQAAVTNYKYLLIDVLNLMTLEP